MADEDRIMTWHPQGKDGVNILRRNMIVSGSLSLKL